MSVAVERALSLAQFCRASGYSTGICIVVDSRRPSWSRRMTVWNIAEQRVEFSARVALGRGKTLADRLLHRTGDTPESWLTPIGRCLCAERYEGKFGTSYRLDGLEESNRNMRSRAVVLHSDGCVSDRFLCGSLWCSRGCIVVSPSTLSRLAQSLDSGGVVIEIFC